MVIYVNYTYRVPHTPSQITSNYVTYGIVSEALRQLPASELWPVSPSITFNLLIFWKYPEVQGVISKFTANYFPHVGKPKMLGKNLSIRFQKIWYRKKSLGIGFGQIFGIVIQCWYVPFTHIMSRKCQKLQFRVLVGRFGSQNAMAGRLYDLGAGAIGLIFQAFDRTWNIMGVCRWNH